MIENIDGFNFKGKTRTQAQLMLDASEREYAVKVEWAKRWRAAAMETPEMRHLIASAGPYSEIVLMACPPLHVPAPPREVPVEKPYVPNVWVCAEASTTGEGGAAPLTVLGGTISVTGISLKPCVPMVFVVVQEVDMGDDDYEEQTESIKSNFASAWARAIEIRGNIEVWAVGE